MDCSNNNIVAAVPSPVKSFYSRLSSSSLRNHNDAENNNVTTSALQASVTLENEYDRYQCDANDETIKQEEEYVPPNPDYSRADSLLFSKLTTRLEAVWSQRKQMRSRKKKPPSKDELLQSLLPRMSYLKGGSAFPFIRLMIPDKDTIRPHCGMKEKTIATTWAEAIGLSKTSRDSLKLLNYNDPIHASSTACGDLSLGILEVMEKRYPFSKSKITVGEVNDLLDELAMMKRQQKQTFRTKLQMKVQWVERLIAKQFSPLEHKWIVRILLQKLELGVSSESILNYCHLFAQDLYSANKNIRTLFATLCDSAYIKNKQEQIQNEKNAIDNENKMNYMPTCHEPVVLNSTIAPMLSMRTSFASLLSDIQKRHQNYMDTIKDDNNNTTNSSSLCQSLALKFPSFVAEIKLDGERLLAHVKRGIVKLQTRNSVWYSDLYSPVLGPPLRRALEKYDVDVILDGELIAWDDGRNETIPFGENRSVAKYRIEWLQERHEIDERDINMHDAESEGVNVMSRAVSSMFEKPIKGKTEEDILECGKECWLKFVVFDILYLGGPDARKVIQESCGFFTNSKLTCTGSLLNLSLTKRKCILYSVIQPQKNMVEIMETKVIRSDGTCVDGSEYFVPDCGKSSLFEYNYHPAVLDSIECTLQNDIPDLKEVDLQRRKGQSDHKIETRRVESLELFHTEIVMRRCLEGLIFKDLATPYGLGSRFRNKGYWFKLKDDYNQSGYAADIDVLVLGGSFATGMSKAGMLNRFLVGCRDSDTSDDGVTFMTLCNVSGGGTTTKNLERLLQSTGFKIGNAQEKGDYGSWFPSDRKNMPDFISQRSYQRSMTSDKNGWKSTRDSYPDVWIRPQDSFVLTLNAGEIVSSTDHSSGVSLRFPRISRIRAKDFDDPKEPSEVESVTDLHERYFQRQSQQQAVENEELSFSTTNNKEDTEPSRKFLTSEQHSKDTIAKRKKSRRVDKVRAPNILSTKLTSESKIFEGYNFLVLEGTYNLDSDDIYYQDARDEGWYNDAKAICCQQDVVDFILKHGGKCDLINSSQTSFIVGGNIDDARVANHRRAIEAYRVDASKTKTRKRGVDLTEITGVLKWIFLLQTVNRIQENETLKENPVVLKPRRFDFLVLSKAAEESFLDTEDIYGLHLFEDTNMIDFKLALRQAGKNILKDEVDNQLRANKRLKLSKDIEPSSSWQYRGVTALDDDEKWVLSGPRQHFWRPGNRKKDEIMVLYPYLIDIGDDDSYSKGTTSIVQGNDSNDSGVTSKVASVLPLAKAMGAQIISSIQNDVTHILCEMKVMNSFQWNVHSSATSFTDIVIRGSTLHSRLLKLQRPSSTITLVSPAWIRQHWNQ